MNEWGGRGQNGLMPPLGAAQRPRHTQQEDFPESAAGAKGSLATKVGAVGIAGPENWPQLGGQQKCASGEWGENKQAKGHSGK